MTPEEFEGVLDQAAEWLSGDLRASTMLHDQARFEQGVQDTLRRAAEHQGLSVGPSFHPHAFPDIRANGYGVEVKYTSQDTWLAVGNSIFEGMRDPDVQRVYVMYGKSGGVPEARWARYEDCISHVRVSHAPRFVVDLDNGLRLFDKIPVSYDKFATLSDEEKMSHIRDYSRGRLAEGERLWWLEPSHSVPVAVRFYQHLSQDEKRMLRAEAALLVPAVCSTRQIKGKYEDVAHHILMHHGVICPQTRDLFSAGSVAGARGDGNNPQGPYIIHSLLDIQHLIQEAAERLDDALFVEYWGESCPPEQRIKRWLELADEYAAPRWQPSTTLFLVD